MVEEEEAWGKCGSWVCVEEGAVGNCGCKCAEEETPWNRDCECVEEEEEALGWALDVSMVLRDG